MRCASRPRLFHLRQEQRRHEVDILIEYGGGRVFAIEVKATSAPRRDDIRHFAWLRDELGDRFSVVPYSTLDIGRSRCGSAYRGTHLNSLDKLMVAGLAA